MSLRTPSTSFEEKKESDGTSINLSPDDPPKILNSTQQKRAVEMFEVRATHFLGTGWSVRLEFLNA
jgi:hypothetical protein